MKPWLLAGMLIVTALLGASGGTARAQSATRCEVMIDASGSMRGFKDAPVQSLHLVTLLDRLRAHCGNAALFGDGTQPRPLRAGEAAVFEDGNTNIGANLASWSRRAPDGALLVLVTDNVEDLPGETSRNQDFYQLLRGRDSLFSHITVLALRAPFTGLLYPPGPPDPRIPPVSYGGARAFTIYLLAKGATDREAYQALRGRLLDILRESGRQPSGNGDDAFAQFDVRPFAEETLRVDSGNVRITEGSGRASQCAQARFDPATNSFSILDQPLDQACDVQARVMVQIPERWCLKRTSLSGSLEDSQIGDTALEQAVTVNVEPPTADLCQRQVELVVTVRFNPFRFRDEVSFADKLTRAFQGTFRAGGRLVLVGAIERGNVDLGEGVGQSWSFPEAGGLMSTDPAIQRRVFRLDGAIRAVIPDAALERLKLAEYQVDAEIRYDALPVLLLLGLILLVLIALAALIWLARKPLTLSVASDDGADALLHLGLFGSARVQAGTGEIAIRIRNLSLWLLVSAKARIRRGRLLGRSGGDVEVAHGKTRVPSHSGGARDGFNADPGDVLDSGQAIRFRIRAVSEKTKDREGFDDGF